MSKGRKIYKDKDKIRRTFSTIVFPSSVFFQDFDFLLHCSCGNLEKRRTRRRDVKNLCMFSIYTLGLLKNTSERNNSELQRSHTLLDDLSGCINLK